MSFVAESRERTRPVLPLAGMVDVLFLLLIFFMTASTFRESELELPVSLTPGESATQPVDAASSVVVTVTEANELFFGTRATTLQELRGLLEEVVAVSPNEVLVVRSDEKSDAGVLLRILDQAELAGVRDTRTAMIRAAEGGG
ncbi:MAG: biopolymer transporter ExbD [Planctomycetota bacterium]